MKRLLLTLVSVSCLVACQPKTDEKKVTGNQPVYDHINQTNTIRCGYVVWPPAFTMDPNTKQKGGVFYDVMEELGKRLNLKVEWAEELGWATATEAVKTHRVDMLCSGLWPNSNRARQADFSTAITYSLMYAWKSAASDKSYQTLSDMNKPEVRFGFIDGTTPEKIIHRQFASSTMVSNPEMTPISDLLEGLLTKKHDLMLIDEATANDFLSKNPGSVVRAVNQPVSFFPNVIMLPAGETKLKGMIDNTFNEMLYDGTIAKILVKNNQLNNYKFPAKPYQD